MNAADLDQRPLKKRRFFVDENEPVPATNETTPTPNLDASTPCSRPDEHNHGSRQDTESPRALAVEDTRPIIPNESPNTSTSTLSPATPNERDSTRETLRECSEGTAGGAPSPLENTEGFDVNLFASIIGEQLPVDTVKSIENAASGNLEKAINIYFDGSWRQLEKKTTNASRSAFRQQTLRVQNTPVKEAASKTEQSNDSAPADALLQSQPPLRYIGAFGVGAWATRSGTGLLKHGEHVNIERSRSQPTVKRARGGKLITNQKVDILTRFTNSSGQEIGRLPRETAEWVSTLLDQKICRFEGVCVFVPHRMRVNDTIYLQLRSFLCKEVFQPRVFQGAADDNRSTGLFEEKESTEEKNLRLRQVALVRLFDEIGLQPASMNDLTKKHKKEGLLRAAEVSEQYDKVKKEDKGNESPEENESEELEEDQLDNLYKKAQTFDFSMPEAEPPSTFTMSLRTYQKQALHWMLAKEKDNKMGRERSMHPLWEEYEWPTKDVDDQALPKVHGLDNFYVNPYSGELRLDFPTQEQHCLGGILADEMGLGKTIEMLSLVHAHRYEPGDKTMNDPDSANGITKPPGAPGTNPAPYTTLVVAPTSLLAQWESEALKASQPGTMRVLTYYGADRSNNTGLRGVCSASNPSAPNVIVTSYGVVLSDFYFASQSEFAHIGLFSVDFFRVILDEAHLIKNRRSKSARACYELKATHRWVLTGTPIVNRLEDLFSLVRFLKVEPWNNFSFWKTFITVPFGSKDYVRALSVVQTVLEPLVLRRTKTMKMPDGEPLVPLPHRTIAIEEVDLTEQEREIYDHIFTRAKRAFNDNVEAGTLMKSFSTLFAQVLRLRQCCCHPVLTRKKAIVADEEDAAAAADDSNGLKDDMDLQELIDRFTTTTEKAESDESRDSSSKFTAHALRQIQTESSGECPICSEEPMIDPAVTACWHSACKKCLEDFIRHQTDKGLPPRCFSCRAPINSKDIFEVIRHQSPNSAPESGDIYSNTPPCSSQLPPRISLRRINPLSPSALTSAKIHALVNHITRVPAGTKSVVFSQFTSFLDLIAPQLTREGITHLRLDGSMQQKTRAEVLAQFNKTDIFDIDEETLESSQPPKPASAQASSSPRVLLISLRAGGVGLNLTAASNVFMMDPWWSFATEAQAIDRVHRMGQLRDVSVTRFVVRDSIEGRMLRVQERKMNIAGSLGLRVGGDGNEDDKGKDRIEELKMLFE
ncbi:hypothetical protein PHISP_02946 [Aspergillus sp. HF37]|nr:hypothetical protein PHISP_02946 [Aspergillus sp. HF37]